MSDFYDITDPGEFLPEPSTPWWVWVIVGITALSVAIVTTIIIKKIQQSKLQTTQLDEVRAQLDKLRNESENLPPHLIATRISLIIRRYLAIAFNDPALFETNEEFTLRKSALTQLSPESRTLISQHLTDLSQLKYAPHHSPDNNQQLIDKAESILANIEINVDDLQTDELTS